MGIAAEQDTLVPLGTLAAVDSPVEGSPVAAGSPVVGNPVADSPVAGNLAVVGTLVDGSPVEDNLVAADLGSVVAFVSFNKKYRKGGQGQLRLDRFKLMHATRGIQNTY